MGWTEQRLFDSRTKTHLWLCKRTHGHTWSQAENARHTQTGTSYHACVSTNTHSSPVLCSHIWRKLPDEQVDRRGWASWSIITLDVKQVDAILQADQWKHLGGHYGQRTMRNSNHGSCIHWCERIIAHLKCLLWKYSICLCVRGHAGTYRGTLCWNVHRLLLPDECEDKSIAPTSGSLVAESSSIIRWSRGDRCVETHMHTHSHWQWPPRDHHLHAKASDISPRCPAPRETHPSASLHVSHLLPPLSPSSGHFLLVFPVSLFLHLWLSSLIWRQCVLTVQWAPLFYWKCI